jgi:hypothetical protein
MAGFRKATKQAAKLRAAIFGPSGAGKTYSLLRIASGLGGRIAVIDTERGSASKYSDRFDFDVMDLDDKTIAGYCEAIHEAAREGYAVLGIDSLSHAWQELLEDVEKIAKARYRGNTWSAWSEGTPKQRKLVNAILDFPGHVLVTMRSKTEWQTGEGKNGKSAPVRVGLAPEQGKGIEYEFDLLLEINPDHQASVIKDRTGKFQDKILDRPGEDFGRELAAWLADGSPAPVASPTPATASAPEINTEAWTRFATETTREFNADLDALYREHAVPDVLRSQGKVSVAMLAMHVANIAVTKGATAPPKRTLEWSTGLASKLYAKKQEQVESEVKHFLDEQYELVRSKHAQPADDGGRVPDDSDLEEALQS